MPGLAVEANINILCNKSPPAPIPVSVICCSAEEDINTLELPPDSMRLFGCVNIVSGIRSMVGFMHGCVLQSSTWLSMAGQVASDVLPERLCDRDLFPPEHESLQEVQLL